MAELVTITQVKASLGLGTDTDIDAAALDAAKSATAQLESLLRTNFSRDTAAVDYFFVHNSLKHGDQYNTRIILSAGAVDSGQDVNVYIASTYAKANATDGTDLRSPDDDYVVIDYENGVIDIRDYALNNTYIKVEYTKGYAFQSAPNTTVYDGVPQWLEQACILSAQMILLRNPIVVVDVQDQKDIKETERAFDQIIQGHIRYYPISTKPL